MIGLAFSSISLSYLSGRAQAAKKIFDETRYGKDKKLSTVASLRAEYATTALAEKKKLYAEYKAARSDMQSIQTAKFHVDLLLGMADDKR